jgi:hypothetical protein
LGGEQIYIYICLCFFLLSPPHQMNGP